MKPLLIDLHSLVRVWAPQSSESVHTFLARQFPLFVSDQRAEAAASPDILLRPMGDAPAVTERKLHSSALFGFSLFPDAKGTAVGWLRRGSPDLLLLPGDPMTILYRPRPGIEGRLYGLLLLAIQLCLRAKQALLLHAAVLEKGGQSILLSGHRGSGKSQLLLTFLRQGWNYLSDDKCILHSGSACLFESHIYLNDHLRAGLPWLQTLHPSSPLQRGARMLRQRLRPLAYRLLPRRAPQRLERLLDPAQATDLRSLFPVCEMRTRVPLNYVFLLFQGKKFSVDGISREAAVDGLEDILALLFSDFDSMVSMLNLYAGRRWESPGSLIERNLPQIPCYRVQLPEEYDPDEVCQEISRCCAAR